MLGFLPLVAIVIFLLIASLRVLNEYERGVVFRLGRIIGAKGPGLILLFPVIDRMTKVSLRTFALDVPHQDVITKDNVSIKVNAVVYFRVAEPIKAILEVEDYMYATSQICQTTLRSVCGGVELDEILAHRDKVNEQVQTILDSHTGPWGIKVANVELKYIDLPQEMQRAMAKQAEAERERRAKIINAEGEFQASTRLAEAAEIISVRPEAMQLRYLQTIREMASESQATTILPIPLDFIRSFFHGPSHAAMETARGQSAVPSAQAREVKIQDDPASPGAVEASRNDA